MKRKILEADLDRREKKVLTEQELEAKELAQAQLERAGALKMEQEEEIRMLNKVGGSRLPLFLEGQAGFGFFVETSPLERADVPSADPRRSVPGH